jgi:hypothetical protein
MRRGRLAILLLLATAATAVAVEINVTTDPPLDAVNLVRNADMERGADGQAADWSFSTAIPENFTLGWPEGAGRNGSRALHIIAHDKVMSGYWYQEVPVQPGDYVFRGYYRTVTGRLLMYAHGTNTDVQPAVGVDARAFHGSSIASFLVPVFVPLEALAGPDPETYYPFSVKVAVPEGLEQITLSMGLYFTPGEVWFDDVWFGRATMQMRLNVSGEGERLESLRVLREGSATPLYSSASDPNCPAGQPLPEPFTVTLDAVPTDGDYVIEAKTVGGELQRIRFPEEAE